MRDEFTSAARRLPAVAALALSLSPFGNARAADEAFGSLEKAAIVLGTFDRFAGECARGRGFDARERGQIAAWEAEHGVEGVRARVAEQARDPRRRQGVEAAVGAIVGRLGAAAKDPCAAAVSVIRTREARFASSPDPAPPPAPVAESPRAETPRPPPASAGPGPATLSLLAEIDSFGFDTRLVMGVGGFLTTDIFPVMLFRDGRALTDIGALATHSQAPPKAWTRWRRTGGELQIAGEKGWRKLPFQTTYARLPDGFRLDGLYRRLGGTGTVAIGGDSSVAVWDEYRFHPDGRVERGGGAGARAAAGDTSVATAGAAPGRRGRYRVEGLVLEIRYDDGAEERRVLVTDPADPKGAIWLDGEGYVQRRR